MSSTAPIAHPLQAALLMGWNHEKVAEEIGVHPQTFRRMRAKGDAPPVALWITPTMPRWDPHVVREWAIQKGGTTYLRFRIPNVPAPAPSSAPVETTSP